MSFAQARHGDEIGLAAYERMFHLTPAAMALAATDDSVLRVVVANDAFLELVGASRARIEGQQLDAAFRAAAAEQIRRGAAMAVERDECVRLRVAHAKAYDVARLEVEIRPLVVGGRRHVLLSLSTSGPATTLSELGESGVLAELGALSRGLVYIHDLSRHVLRHAKHPLADRLGLLGGELDMDEIRAMVHPDDLERFRAYAASQADAPDERVSTATFRFRAADGAWIWIGVRTRVFTRDPEGHVQGVIGVATDLTEEYEHAAALSQAATALARAELNERRRIGRELHDSTAQLLVAARLGLGLLERRPIDEEARRLLEDVRQSVAGAQNEIRNFTYILHPPALQEQGLERCLRAFAAGFARRAGLPVSVKIARGKWRLPFAIEMALYRVSQEALMNVYRHAQASKARMRLLRAGGEIVLEIEDDGVGLPKSRAPDKAQGVGISGMKARMLQLGGQLEILDTGNGVKVRAAIAEWALSPRAPSGRV